MKSDSVFRTAYDGFYVRPSAGRWHWHRKTSVFRRDYRVYNENLYESEDSMATTPRPRLAAGHAHDCRHMSRRVIGRTRSYWVSAPLHGSAGDTPAGCREDASTTRRWYPAYALRSPARHTPALTPAPAYLITSSAWKRSVGGIVRPSASAVLRLMTSSNVVGCSTGRSAGLAPLRILST